MRLMARAVDSTTFLLTGLNILIKAPGLLKWAVIPFLIDLTLAIAAFIWGAANASAWITSALSFFISQSSGVFVWLYWPFLILFWIVFIVVVLYGAFLISSIIASPFNSILAEKTLIYLGTLPERPFEFRRWLRTSFKMFITSLIRTLVFLVIGLFLFLLSFVPILNLLAAYLALLVMVSDCLDYSLEVMELNFRQRIRYMATHLPEMSGMAGCMAVTVLVPGLTVLLLPAAVVGASKVVSKTKIK